MAERFKAHAWKVCVLSKEPWVRIPLSPPQPTTCQRIKKNDIIMSIKNRSKNGSSDCSWSSVMDATNNVLRKKKAF